MINTDTIARLKDFGLNTYEAKLWTSLLSKGIAGAGELSELSNVPRSRTYDVLESLEKKGFLIIKLGKPTKYIPVSPKDVLQNYRNRIKEEANKQLNQIEAVEKSDFFYDLNQMHETQLINEDLLQSSTVLKGKLNLTNQINLCLNSANKTIHIMTTEKGARQKIDVFYNSLKELKSKGIKINIIAPIQDIELLEKIKTVSNFKFSDIHNKFIAIDGKEVLLINDNDHPDYQSAIWVKTPFISNGMVSMFNHIFER